MSERRQTTKSLQKRLEKAKLEIVAKRDELRVIVDDAEEILECCNEAECALEDAIDALSKYL
jgi:hypothetical protein